MWNVHKTPATRRDNAKILSTRAAPHMVTLNAPILLPVWGKNRPAKVPIWDIHFVPEQGTRVFRPVSSPIIIR